MAQGSARGRFAAECNLASDDLMSKNDIAASLENAHQLVIAERRLATASRRGGKLLTA
jgi:hypothetical protein